MQIIELRTAITILAVKERGVVVGLGSDVLGRGLMVVRVEDCVIVAEFVEEDVGDDEMREEIDCCCCCCCCCD